jgi:hypothetical protein
MIAKAPEIVATHHLNDIEGFRSAQTSEEKLQYGEGWEVPFRDKSDLLSYKEKELPHLTQDIRQRGFDWHSPIQAGHLNYDHQLNNSVSIVDGHHRLAAMYHHRPDEFVPLQTTHYDGAPRRRTSEEYEHPVS